VTGTALPAWSVGAAQRHSNVPEVVDHRFQLGLPHRACRRNVLLRDPGRLQLLLSPVDRLDDRRGVDAGFNRGVQPSQPLLGLGDSLGRCRAACGVGSAGVGVEQAADCLIAVLGIESVPIHPFTGPTIAVSER
jgi:hypothetical protein